MPFRPLFPLPPLILSFFSREFGIKGIEAERAPPGAEMGTKPAKEWPRPTAPRGQPSWETRPFPCDRRPFLGLTFPPPHPSLRFLSFNSKTKRFFAPRAEPLYSSPLCTHFARRGGGMKPLVQLGGDLRFVSASLPKPSLVFAHDRRRRASSAHSQPSPTRCCAPSV